MPKFKLKSVNKSEKVAHFLGKKVDFNQIWYKYLIFDSYYCIRFCKNKKKSLSPQTFIENIYL